MRRTITSFYKIAAAAIVLGCAGSAGAQQAAPARPTFLPDGSVQVPAFNLPPSAFLSPEALAFQKGRGTMAMPTGMAGGSIEETRAGLEKYLAPTVDAFRARYAVDVVEQKIGGVPTRVFTPKGAAIDPKRVLINLHGGAFSMCAIACSYQESIPIAAVGKFKVISIDYRMGPEHVFPAANEDVVAVYRELLKTYKAKQIGIYGCSAGGALSGQVAAWLPAHGLPQVGAIGIFGSGAVRGGPGDSNTISANIDGSGGPPPPAPGAARPRSYFDGTAPNDPMVSPATNPALAAKFPPTLLITGSRAPDMTSAIVTHSLLLKAGVDSNLVVAEGMGHCYITQSQLPEARDAFDVIVKFFRKHLD